ncbi:MAG: Rrf2 family transcriptional regulator [SAR202 cluster bacterium]|nr:Rrf2 family transcriptional regulator [SAR202 cluster bacterium]
MHIPMQVDYGVRALIDLAEHESEGPVRASDIAQRQGIPEPYLARVLHMLQRQGITASQRGPLGGHALARPPSQITMGEVMVNLGGTINLVSCLDDAGRCTQSPQCGQRSVWRDVEQAIQNVLNNTTIADLVERMKQPAEAVHNEAVTTA